MQIVRFLAILSLFLLGTGCGDGIKRARINGKLTARGKPVDNCSVQMFPATPGMQVPGALGITDSNGNFTVISSRAGDTGVPAGEYKVILSRMVNTDGTVLPPEATQADFPNAIESIPRKYTDPAATTLRITVPESGGAVSLDMPDNLLVIRGKK